MIIPRTVPAIMDYYKCSAETAQLYIDLREEGYGQTQALLLAGLADPGSIRVFALCESVSKGRRR